MEKGFNTMVESTRKEIAELISVKIKMLPISVVSLILENVLIEVKALLDRAIAQEAIKYTAEQEKIKKEQNEWVPEEETE